jgi:hypothetical protein
MTKQQFIINTLKPYFLDMNRCGYDMVLNECRYLTSEGKTCAVGKWLDKNNCNYKKIINGNMKVIAVNTKYGLDNVLVEEAKNMMNIHEWQLVQNIHDNLAKGHLDYSLEYIQVLEKECNINLVELKDLRFTSR